MFNLIKDCFIPKNEKDGWLVLSIVARETNSPWFKSKIKMVCKNIVEIGDSDKHIEIFTDITNLCVGCFLMYKVGHNFRIFHDSSRVFIHVQILPKRMISVLLFQHIFVCKIENFKHNLYLLTTSNVFYKRINDLKYPLMAF